MPLAISSKKWRQYMEEKDKEKENILKKREERKRLMTNKKEEQAKRRLEISKRKQCNKRKEAATRKMTTKKSAANSESNIKMKENRLPTIYCAGCNDELISDVEDDSLKNIGCDNCPKWFHLKCTTKKNFKYDEVAKEDFVCHYCLIHMI
ncbi:unnamed protein product [Parnassius apollo]|uniref:(apollo) hypothetical protein n=1 Tax=Parnassius apollo TaxID=110799 RepID=A0A8S3XIZ9_PARAO|nr:unnamed protein product [Parnassius apollo]